MSPSPPRVQRSRFPQPVRHARRPHAVRVRARAQANSRCLTGAVELGTGAATAWIGVLVTSEYPSAEPVPPAKLSTPGTSAPFGKPTTSTRSAPPTTPAPALSDVSANDHDDEARRDVGWLLAPLGTAHIQENSAVRAMEIIPEANPFGLRPAVLALKMTAKRMAGAR
jgi:hypothetical protein